MRPRWGECVQSGWLSDRRSRWLPTLPGLNRHPRDEPYFADGDRWKVRGWCRSLEAFVVGEGPEALDFGLPGVFAVEEFSDGPLRSGRGAGVESGEKVLLVFDAEGRAVFVDELRGVSEGLWNVR